MPEPKRLVARRETVVTVRTTASLVAPVARDMVFAPRKRRYIEEQCRPVDLHQFFTLGGALDFVGPGKGM